MNLIDLFFWKFISDAFDFEFNNSEEFCQKYNSFEEIEKGLVNFVRDHLIFNDFSDKQLPLRKKIERLQVDRANISSLIANKSDGQCFLISVYSYVAQIADMLYICSLLRINPYIRFDVTFHYLTLVMHVFIDDINLRAIIEKSIICYLFRKRIDVGIYKKLTFFDYCQILEKKSMLNAIIEKIQSLRINIFEDEVEKVVSIIDNEFQTWWKNESYAN